MKDVYWWKVAIIMLLLRTQYIPSTSACVCVRTERRERDRQRGKKKIWKCSFIIRMDTISIVASDSWTCSSFSIFNFCSIAGVVAAALCRQHDDGWSLHRLHRHRRRHHSVLQLISVAFYLLLRYLCATTTSIRNYARCNFLFLTYFLSLSIFLSPSSSLSVSLSSLSLCLFIRCIALIIVWQQTHKSNRYTHTHSLPIGNVCNKLTLLRWQLCICYSYCLSLISNHSMHNMGV